MTETELMKKVSVLPENLKEEVSDYVDFLISKYVPFDRLIIAQGMTERFQIISKDSNFSLYPTDLHW